MDEEQTSKEVEERVEEILGSFDDAPKPEAEAKPQFVVILLKNGMQLNQLPLVEFTALGVSVQASIVMKPKNPREKPREVVTNRLIPWGAILMVDLLPTPDDEVLA